MDTERERQEDVIMRTWKMEVSGHRKRKTEEDVVMRTWKMEVSGH